MVCPLTDLNNLNELKNMTFRFLWKGKPDRIKREDSYLPVSMGGLNMPDIECFWSSLKMSWARRLMSPSCLWQKILQLNHPWLFEKAKEKQCYCTACKCTLQMRSSAIIDHESIFLSLTEKGINVAGT